MHMYSPVASLRPTDVNTRSAVHYADVKRDAVQLSVSVCIDSQWENLDTGLLILAIASGEGEW